MPQKRFALNAPHDLDQFLCPAEEFASAAAPHDFGKRPDPPRNDRSRLPECFDKNDSKCFKADRGNDQRQSVMVIAVQRIRPKTAEEPNRGNTRRQTLQSRSVLSVSDHEQIRVLVVAKNGDNIIQPLDPLQPADEEKIRPRVRRLGLRHRFAVWSFWEEMIDNFHLMREPKLMMFVAAELTHRNKSIDVFQLAVEVCRVSPSLGRTPIPQHAPQALLACTRLAIMTPQDVTRTNQPVLVRHIELQGAACA